LRFQLRLAGVPIDERADRDARLRDDKARLDLAGRTPKPGGTVTGPLFSPRQRELSDIAPWTSDPEKET
jgi:hypothetical protein